MIYKKYLYTYTYIGIYVLMHSHLCVASGYGNLNTLL